MMSLNNKVLKARFSDESIENRMERDGFVYVPNFIPKAKLKLIKDMYDDYYTDNHQGMWNSLYNLETEKSRKLSNLIADQILPELSQTFEKFDLPMATIMSKNPGDAGVCEFHRDFSVLDENKFTYRNIWISLIDVNKYNGALYVLRGSHKVFIYPLPMFCKWPYINMQKDLFEMSETIEVSAGDLVVYADKTLHGSHLNLSQVSRPVIHFGLVHPDCQPAYYHLRDNKVFLYKVNYNFFLENKFDEIENGNYELINSFDYLPPSLALDDVKNSLRLNN